MTINTKFIEVIGVFQDYMIWVKFHVSSWVRLGQGENIW